MCNWYQLLVNSTELNGENSMLTTEWQTVGPKTSNFRNICSVIDTHLFYPVPLWVKLKSNLKNLDVCPILEYFVKLFWTFDNYLSGFSFSASLKIVNSSYTMGIWNTKFYFFNFKWDYRHFHRRYCTIIEKTHDIQLLKNWKHLDPLVFFHLLHV